MAETKAPDPASPVEEARQALIKRLMSGAELCSNGCLIWVRSKNVEGYGRFSINRAGHYAHRVSYTLFVEPIPDDMVIDHLCRNRACIEPSHLEVVSNRENILRGTSGSAVNARKTHCKRGHPLLGDNLYLQKDGRRSCMECRRNNLRKLRAEGRVA